MAVTVLRNDKTFHMNFISFFLRQCQGGQKHCTRSLGLPTKHHSHQVNRQGFKWKAKKIKAIKPRLFQSVNPGKMKNNKLKYCNHMPTILTRHYEMEMTFRRLMMTNQ